MTKALMNIRALAFLWLLIAGALTAGAAEPDTLYLLNGTVVTGQFLAGDDKTIVMRVGELTFIYPKSDCSALYLHGVKPEEPGRTVALPPPTLTGAHTLTYHQLTGSDDAMAVGNGITPMLSRNGQRVVMAYTPAKDDPDKKERVAVIDADGNNYRFVDAYKPLFYTSLLVAISANGKWVASTDGGQIRLASAEGNGGRTIFAVMNNISYLRPSADGSAVFFVLIKDAIIPEGNKRLERGVYAIRADGTGLRQIAGATAIARVLGLQPAEVGGLYSSSRGYGLDISDDDRRLVFLVTGQYYGNTQYAMTVNTDGTELRRVLSASQYMMAVGISGDGGTVGAILREKEVDQYQGWVVRSDGTGARKVSEQAASTGIVCLNYDGSQVVFGQEAVLYQTAGQGRLVLGVSSSPTMACRLSRKQLAYLTMDDTGCRFSWVMEDEKSRYQLARVDLDPERPGNAPLISAAQAVPARVIADDRMLSTLSAKVQTDYQLVGGIGVTSFLDNGLQDSYVGNTATMFDNGKSGDKTAGDGIFTSDILKAGKTALPGPHLLRLYAEVRTPNGWHYATASETGPFTVNAP